MSNDHFNVLMNRAHWHHEQWQWYCWTYPKDLKTGKPLPPVWRVWPTPEFHQTAMKSASHHQRHSARLYEEARQLRATLTR